jgi:hypothetical protein
MSNRFNVRVTAVVFTTLAALQTLAARPAAASLVLALELDEMVRRADHIAVADVVSVRSDWDEKHERILTTVQLDVVESWKGPATPATRITIVQPGGTVGDISMVVFGMSQFKAGERSVLFLRGTMAGAAVLGMAQGKRLVHRDPTGRWMAEAPDRRGAQFVKAPNASGAGVTPLPPNDAGFRQRPLDEFKRDVQTLMKASP